MASPDVSVLKDARQKHLAVYKALDQLSKQFGPEVFRILGQRYFEHQRKQSALKREIAEQEKRLRELQQKAQPKK